MQPVKLVPGQLAEYTPALNVGGWTRASLIRWRAGLPEKLGGWQKFYPLSFGTPIRDLHAWEGINVDKHLSVGGETVLAVINGDTIQTVNVITPQITTTNSTPNFSTVNGSNVVTIIDPGFTPTTDSTIFIATPVAIAGIVLSGSYRIATVGGAHTYTIQAASNATATVNNAGAVPTFTTVNGTPTVTVTLPVHGLSVGSTFYVFVSTTGGGLTIFGAYIVQTVPGANTFTINAPILASSGVTFPENAGLVRTLYYVGIGPVPQSAGYGVGPYGQGGYGKGVAVPATAGTPIVATDWTTENWGEILLACPENGAIYSWSPDSGFFVAIQVFGSPIINGGIFTAMPARILVAWASSTNGVQDPLLIRWSDSEDFTVWNATSQNQAGSYRIPRGSRIVGGIQGPNYALIWTDLEVWSMQYVGSDFVFGFTALAEQCGAVSSHAMQVSGDTVYWMSAFQFYKLDGGGVVPIDCPVWDVIFQDLDQTNIHKVRCGTNSGFDEVIWYYPSLSGGSGEVDSYVKLNTAPANGGNAWDSGRLDRTAWIDQNVFGEPIGADSNGFIFQHEVSDDADGAALTPLIETGLFAISEGDDLIFIDWLLPDFKYRKFPQDNPFSSGFSSGFGSSPGATLSVTLLVTDYPNVVPTEIGPFIVDPSVPFIAPRGRGRLIGLRISSSDLGTWWRLGNCRYRGAIDGKR